MYVNFNKIIDTIIVYIYDKKYLNKNVNDVIKQIFNNLNKYYNYYINFSYNIKLYINKYYGIILEIKEKNKIEEDLININVKVLKDVLFLYEVDDPLDYLNEEIYYYNDKYYINLKKFNINIIENSNIIYGKDVYKIIGKGIKL